LARWRNPATVRAACVWLLPPAAAAITFVALLLQRGGTWAAAMPAARFPISGRDSGFVLLTGTDRADDLVASALDAPARVLWLVPGEAVTPQFAERSDGASAFVAVDADGSLWRAARDPAGKVRRQSEPVRRRLARKSDLVVASDATIEVALRRRLPALSDLPAAITFDKLLDRDRADRADDLDPMIMVRAAGLIGLFAAAMVLMGNLSTATSPSLRWATALLGFPAATALLGGAFVVCAPWASWVMTVLPFALWVILGAACRFTDRGSTQAAPASNPARQVVWIAGAVACAIWIQHVAQGFVQKHLTIGDSVRYLTAAHRTYELGHWPLAEMASEGRGSGLTAMYPPGPSIFMAYCFWEVGVEPERMFHPGRRTGAIWLLYAGFLAGLTITVSAAAVLAVSHLFPGRRGLATVVAAAGVLYCLPTTRAYVHAGEAILWPLLAAAFVGLILARSARCPFAAATAIVSVGGTLLIKPEATVILAVLVLPFALTLLGPMVRRARFSLKPAVVMAIAAIVAFAPFLDWRRQKSVEGVPSKAGLIRPFGPADLIAERAVYGRVLKRTWRMLVGPMGADDDPTFHPAVHHGAAVLLSIAALIAALQFLRHRWTMWAVPVGCAVYFLGLSATYVFTDFPAGREVQIEVSWNRLMVPMVMTAVAIAAVAGAELSRVLGALARRRHS